MDHSSAAAHQFRGILQLSKVHVYLTYPFVLSWSLIEAMSVGASIVASGTAPVREVIVDGVNGRLIDFFSVDEVVDAVVQLLINSDVRSKFSRAARGDAVASLRFAEARLMALQSELAVCQTARFAYIKSLRGELGLDNEKK